LGEHIYRAWAGIEPEPFEPVLMALLDAADGERERLAQRCQWLQWWEHEMDRLYNPPPDALELAHEG